MDGDLYKLAESEIGSKNLKSKDPKSKILKREIRYILLL